MHARLGGDSRRSAPSAHPAVRRLAVAALLGLLAFLVYNLNGRTISAADNYPARYLPLGLLREGSLTLTPVLDLVAQGRVVPSAAVKGNALWAVHGRLGEPVSRYPIVTPLLVTPLFLPAKLRLDAVGWEPRMADRLARITEKLAASLIAAFSVALVYLLLRRRAEERLALLLTLAYAFGTTTWVISGQALWQHGLGQVLLAATLLLVTGPRPPERRGGGGRFLAIGLLCGLAVANRQPDAVLAAGLGLYALWWGGWARLPWLALGAALPLGLVVAYNLTYIGNLVGGYAVGVHRGNLSDSALEGFAALLVSPVRGLFVFSPFLLFLPLLFGRALRDPASRPLTLVLAAAVLAQIVGYAFVDWRQGESWGPRWLTDMLPLLVWMLAPVVASLRRPGRCLFVAACVLSAAIQTVGAFWYDGRADVERSAAPRAERNAPYWELSSTPFIAELAHPPAPMDLLMRVAGSLDEIRVVERVVADPAGGEKLARLVTLAGWAQIDGRTPEIVGAMIDGHVLAGSAVFLPRADVARAVGNDHPAGWILEVPAGRLAPGEHSVTIVVRGYPTGEQRMLSARRFTLPAAPAAEGVQPLLDHYAAQAAAALVARQQPEGYWLTPHTASLGFLDPAPEVNTYLNAILLELLEPLPPAMGLAGAMERVRGFLTAQIEADGLVRYHGRPDAPYMGRLGCAITPDTDDTALVWRLAPAADRERLTAALATIERFRRPDGLYRTWLAAREDYRCLDPGADPNPADVGIQLNLLLLLAREDPAAARSLCAALAPRVGEGPLWVYYKVAPLMVALRLADIEAAGCPLRVPPARLVSPVPGQAVWLELAGLLARARGEPPSLALRDAAEALLRRAAAGGFALLASAPPLFYHNDLTANVNRFYWSPELGYALWLRLREEARRLRLACDGAETGATCEGT